MIDTLLGTTAQGNRVSLSEEDRTRHLLVLGKSGTGKSTFLLNLMIQDMQAGRGFCLLDPHGSLVDDVLSSVPPEREHQIVFLDLADEDYPFGLNLFASDDRTPGGKSRRADEVCAAFQKVWGGGWGILIETWLKMLTHTFLDAGHGTLADVPRLLTDQEYREPFIASVRTPFVKTYWEQQTRKDGNLSGEEINSTLRRIGMFLMNSTLANIVGQEQTTVDFTRFMDENTICLIKLPVAKVGEDTAELIGTILLQHLLAAAMGRDRGAKPYFVYADEFQHFVTPDVVKIITGARKFGVGITLATQSLSTIHDPDIRTGVMIVGNMVTFQVGADDATALARELRQPIAERKREVTRFPVKQLLSRVQSDRDLHDLQERLLLPIERDASIPDWRHISQRILQAIDDYLVHVMTGRTRLGSTREVGDLVRIANSLVWSDALILPENSYTPADLYPFLYAACEEAVTGTQDADESVAALRADERYAKLQGPIGRRRSNWFDVLFDHLLLLRDAASSLAAKPLYADSNSEPTRSMIATDLTRLEGLYQRGTAVCKLFTGEYVVQTPMVESATGNDPEMRQRIEERSREQYCRALRPPPKSGKAVDTDRLRQRADELLARYGTRAKMQRPISHAQPAGTPPKKAPDSPPMVRREPRKPT